MLTRGFSEPVHLKALTDLYEQSLTEPVRGLVSVARQHGKTETTKAAFIHRMIRHPGQTHAYVSYEAFRSAKISSEIKYMAELAGLGPEGSRSFWKTRDGSEFFAPGIGGALTGQGITGLLVVDDPHKNRAEAESPAMRERVLDWWRAVAISGVAPDASAVVIHSRWHPDDLIGTLDREPLFGHQTINLPALLDELTPLWPEKYTLEFLLERKGVMGPYDWGSLMMGAPRVRGTSVFGPPTYYEALPQSYRVAIGLDFAYTAKTSSDYSVAVVLALDGENNYYVMDVRRRQLGPAEFCSELRALKAAYPGARWLWHASTTEMGLAATLREHLGFPLLSRVTTTEKFVRAQPVAAAWNARPLGKVLIPRAAPWTEAFERELCSFTGTGDRHDDQVDALAAAFDVFPRGMKGAWTSMVGASGNAPSEAAKAKAAANGGFQW